MYSDELMELLLSEEEVPEQLIYDVTRAACPAAGRHTRLPRLGLSEQRRAAAVGRHRPLSAFAVGTRDYRPAAWTIRTSRSRLSPDPDAPFVGMAFKIVDDPYGQLTFFRIYQGHDREGPDRTSISGRAARNASAESCACTPTSEKKSTMQSAGDIVAVMGIDCASGDTYAATAELLLAGEHVRARTGDPSCRSSPRSRSRCGPPGQGPGSLPQGRSDVPGHGPIRKPTRC